MTKIEWQKHRAEVGEHDYRQCSICAKRAATKRKNANARARHDAYILAGCKRVKGALGGIYYE